MALTKAHNRMIAGSSFNIIDYGAVGDGTTACSTAIQAAIDAAYAVSGSVYIPDGTFLLDAAIDIKCDVSGTGTLKASASITGLSPDGRAAMADITVNDVTVRDISFDCNSVCGALGPQADDVVIDNVSSNNSYRAHIFTSGQGNKGGVIQNCKLTNAGQGEALFGDAIYLNNVYGFRVVNNHIDGYTRIGIVFEGNDVATTDYSYDPVISGNYIKNGDGTGAGTEPAGIWLENTSGGVISGNVIDTVTNTTVPWYSYGIARFGFRGPTTGTTGTVISGNYITNVYVGVLASIATTVSDTHFENVKLGAYTTANTFASGSIVKYANSTFSNCTFDYGGAGWPSGKTPHGFFLSYSNNIKVIIDGIIEHNITRDYVTDSDITDIRLVNNDTSPDYQLTDMILRNIPDGIVYHARNEGGSMTTADGNLTAENVKFTVRDNCKFQGQSYLRFINCDFDNVNTPSSDFMVSNEVTYRGCNELPKVRYDNPASGTVDYQAYDCIIDAPVLQQFLTPVNIHVSNCIFRNVTSRMFYSSTSEPAMIGSFNGNGFLDSSGGGYLVEIGNASDKIVLNANYKDVATALVTNTGSGTVTENNTTQL
jgi:hypothetical protein